jgi:hypothetical protein
VAFACRPPRRTAASECVLGGFGERLA